MSAFEKWALRATGGQPLALCQIIVDIMMNGSSDSEVWEWLEATGDTKYTPDTVRKAATTKLEEWKKAS